MPPEGYREYRKREFCNDIACPVQDKLNSLEQGSEEYEKVREECRKACRYTTHQFHKWLIKRGFLILKNEAGGA
jgi:hypothetical protein